MIEIDTARRRTNNEQFEIVKRDEFILNNDRCESKTIKIGIHSFPARRSALIEKV